MLLKLKHLTCLHIFEVPEPFDRVRHTGILHKFDFYVISGQVLSLLSQIIL